MTGKPTYDGVVAAYSKLVSEKERYRTALEEIERAGWKEGLGTEHAIASHYEIRKIASAALKIDGSKDASDNFVRSRCVMVTLDENLHADSKQLVQVFAEAMAEKLRQAELKYGYSNGWLTDDWEIQCRRQMMEHVAKGDPRDVAIFAAFMWARDWPISPPRKLTPPKRAVTS